MVFDKLKNFYHPSFSGSHWLHTRRMVPASGAVAQRQGVPPPLGVNVDLPPRPYGAAPDTHPMAKGCVLVWLTNVDRDCFGTLKRLP
jgi:hypothetical protein